MSSTIEAQKRNKNYVHNHNQEETRIQVNQNIMVNMQFQINKFFLRKVVIFSGNEL